MLVDVDVLPATMEHAQMIAPLLREDARKEVEAVGMVNPEKVLKTALRQSEFAWTGLADGEIACMWGIQGGTLLSSMGGLWLVTTPVVDKYKFIFLRWSRIFMDELRNTGKYTTIHGLVRGDFERSVTWLKWLGFKINPPSADGTRYFHWENAQ